MVINLPNIFISLGGWDTWKLQCKHHMQYVLISSTHSATVLHKLLWHSENDMWTINAFMLPTFLRNIQNFSLLYFTTRINGN